MGLEKNPARNVRVNISLFWKPVLAQNYAETTRHDDDDDDQKSLTKQTETT